MLLIALASFASPGPAVAQMPGQWIDDDLPREHVVRESQPVEDVPLGDRYVIPSPEPASAINDPDPSRELFAPFGMGSCGETEPPPHPVWNWLPEGVVPIIGPRTPASRRTRFGARPMQGMSWQDRPVSIGGFLGATEGSALQASRTIQDNPGLFVGVGGGWDYDYYWGIEKRLNFANLQIANADHTGHRTAQALFGEYRLTHYPLGDTRLRPYVFTGPGVADFFFDQNGQLLHRTQFLIPFGLGVKYLWNPQVATRLELLDDYTIGTWGMSSMHNVTLNAGLELRFGDGWHIWHLFRRNQE